MDSSQTKVLVAVSFIGAKRLAAGNLHVHLALCSMKVSACVTGPIPSAARGLRLYMW